MILVVWLVFTVNKYSSVVLSVYGWYAYILMPFLLPEICIVPDKPPLPSPVYIKFGSKVLPLDESDSGFSAKNTLISCPTGSCFPLEFTFAASPVLI